MNGLHSKNSQSIAKIYNLLPVLQVLIKTTVKQKKGRKTDLFFIDLGVSAALKLLVF